MYTKKIQVGTIIEPIIPKRGIAIFRSPTGGQFIRTKEQNNIWKAITSLDYHGPGLVVFLSNINDNRDTQKIGPGKILKQGLKVRVSNVYEKHAVGEVLSANLESFKVDSEDNSVSFESAFNKLMTQVDSEDSASEISFGGEIFKQEDIDLLLRLQAALYNYLNGSVLGASSDEDGVSRVTDRDNETSDLEKTDV